MAVDGDGRVLIVGHTQGTLAGSSAGGADVFVRQYDDAGTELWTRQFGTDGSEFGLGVAVDGEGNVLITGATSGALAGSNAGSQDVFVRKVDSTGSEVWTRQFGTTNDEQGRGVAVDAAGNVWIAGYTGGALVGSNAGSRDAFLRKIDASGNHMWTRQFGTTGDDRGLGIAVDGDGNVLITGMAGGALEGSHAGSADVFVRKYDGAGNEVWTRQFGTSGYDSGFGIAVDADGNALVSGAVEGTLEGDFAGSADVFVRKLDRAGVEVWTRQFGTSGFDSAEGVAVDGDGNVLVAGYVEGALEGDHAGGLDAFVRKHDSLGNEVWTDQWGTSSDDQTAGVATTADGIVVITGYTDGSLDGSSAGSTDGFVRTYAP